MQGAKFQSTAEKNYFASWHEMGFFGVDSLFKI
jgi:hypothetical protein